MNYIEFLLSHSRPHHRVHCSLHSHCKAHSPLPPTNTIHIETSVNMSIKYIHFQTAYIIQILISFVPINLTEYKYWHERRRCSRSPLGGRLATTLVATISAVIFFSFFFLFLRRQLFSYKECSDQKTYLAKVA